jgi:iron(III) transport system ATP-binding protein
MPEQPGAADAHGHSGDGKALLCVHHLSKTFPGCDHPVVDDVTFCVNGGEVFVLVGPSGCGKTTTLRAIIGFDSAGGGEVLHNGRLLQRGKVFVPPEKRDIGFVFQDYALFPHLTVLRNVMFGIKNKLRRRRRQLAVEALWMVGLMDFEDRMPHDLSGGQQQRVALARAVAAGSKVILLDEPFSHLDPDTRHATRSEIRTLADRAQLAVVLVTHDQEEALSTADRLGVMREGKLEQVGKPQDVYNQPRTAFVAQFLGRTNLIRCDADGRVGQTPLGSVPLAQSAQGPVTISLRPEHLTMASPTGSDKLVKKPIGKVVAREFKGHDLTYHVRLARVQYVVQTDYSMQFNVGDEVILLPRTEAAIVADSG